MINIRISSNITDYLSISQMSDGIRKREEVELNNVKEISWLHVSSEPLICSYTRRHNCPQSFQTVDPKTWPPAFSQVFSGLLPP